MTVSEHEPACDRDRLWALAVGALSEEEASAHQEHLKACPACRELLATIEADVGALGVHASEGRSPEQLAEQALARSRSLQLRAKRLRWLAFGLLLIAALGGGIYASHRLGEKALERRDLRQLERAIQRIQNTAGTYPATEDELCAALAELKDPHLRFDAQGRPLDHWGHPFRYRCPGTEIPDMFDLWSVGRNGVDEEGTPDDVSNWR